MSENTTYVFSTLAFIAQSNVKELDHLLHEHGNLTIHSKNDA
jgi:hypothetical protein